ncbi:hypothetical protein MASR2M15_12570 [Anaerolineales bacterium]
MRPLFSLFILMISLSLTGFALQAQEASTQSLLVSVDAEAHLSLGKISLPSPTLWVDTNPIAPARYARIDELGLLRFIPAGTDSEGVYSFAPYFEGYQVSSAAENKLLIDEVRWSPNGQQLAFRIASGDVEGNDGVWFWQPARDLPTDPSYQLLRDCPPGCGLVSGGNAERWKSRRIQWSSDNSTLLIDLDLVDEGRTAFTLVNAVRDPESTQARTGPTVYRYSSAHWANNGQHLVVSGFDQTDALVFGMMTRDGSLINMNSASEIGLAWVQDAIQHPDSGELLLLGSPVGASAPLALYNAAGEALSAPVANAAPDSVEWSPNHRAALLKVGQQSFILTITGDVYELTSQRNGATIHWASAIPANASPLPTPEPVSSSIQQILPPVETVMIEITAAPPVTPIEAGQLYVVGIDLLSLKKEPTPDSETLTHLPIGEPLVIIGGPVDDGNVVWWRVQTLEYIGWLPEKIDDYASIISP